ncbi:amiloride-sensitive sodium channel subunit beta-2-like [Ptychodera flava]|uniref:amiloride-sensitive sodium channel subunit beta-2-like n=1 Tax=Ptychodera flava TaxID=63121 RepID=UPI003969EF0A
MDPLIDSKHKDSFSEVLTHLLANSSSHGLPNIQRSKHPVGKLFWALLFLAGVGVLCWQVSVLVATYRKRDVDVTLKMHSNTSIEFPVVTICNTNALKMSALVDDVYMLADLYNANSAFATIMQAYRNIEHLDSEPEKSTGGAEVNDYREEIVLSNSTSAFEAGDYSNITTSTYPSGEQKSSTGPEPSSQPMINNITYPTFANKTNINSSSLSMKTELEDYMDDEDYYNKMDNRHELQYLLRQIMAGKTDEQKATIGHEIQDLLLTCLWKGYPCSPRNFTRVWNAAYGNCYMFHVANSNEHTKPLMINKPGRDNGLTLELFVNQDNYIPDITETSGIRVAIHPHRVVPFPEDNGISLSPGYSTEIGLRMVNIERQPRPYGNCIDANNIPDKYYDNDIYIRRYRAAYSVAACEKSCYQNTLIDRCGCYDADYPPTMDGIDLKPCSILGNSTGK